MRSRKFKIATLIAGVLLAAAPLALLTAWIWPHPSPLRVADVKEGDQVLAAQRGERAVSFTLHNQRGRTVNFNRSWLKTAYSYTSKVGDHTQETTHLLFVPNLEARGSPQSVYQVALVLPNEVETLRLQLSYQSDSRWPFGIGDYQSRFRPPSKSSAWLQRSVRAVSQKLYDSLWPAVPSFRSDHWESASLEVSLPRFIAPTNETSVAQRATHP